MERLKALCKSCGKLTNHSVRVEHKTTGEAYGGNIQWWVDYQVIECLGCGEISFRQVSWSTEDYNPFTDKPEVTVILYPDRASGREPIEGYQYFPARTKRVYLEVLKALNQRMAVLTAIGLRALIQSICLEQDTKNKNLSNGIDELVDMGLLSTRQSEFLHSHRFMGNEAAHAIVAPELGHLVAALDIAETLLKAIYVLPKTADRLKKKA